MMYFDIDIFCHVTEITPSLTDLRVKMRVLCLFLLVAGSVFADEEDKKESVGTVVGIDLGTTYSW